MEPLQCVKNKDDLTQGFTTSKVVMGGFLQEDNMTIAVQEAAAVTVAQFTQIL